MPRLQSRPFATPDEVRTFPHGSAEVLKLDEAVVGRAVYEPGWRWTTAMPPIAGTPTCELHHLGYSISGSHARRDGRRPGARHPARLDLRDPVGSRRMGRRRRAMGDARVDQRPRRSACRPKGPASGSWRPSCSPTSSTRRPSCSGWVTRHGGTCWRHTTACCATTSTSSAGARSPRPGTGSSRSSMAPPAPSDVASR